MIIEDEIVGSQTENESIESDDDSTDEVLALFGVEKKETVEDEPPAKVEVKTEIKTEPKKLTIKFNKEDVEIEEDKIPEYVQKGLALEKERSQKTELEKHLDRAAKLAGYKDHTEYVANFDKIEQEQQQKVKDEYSQLRAELRTEATENGLDPDKVEAYLDNHPLMKEALQAKTERDIERAERQKQTEQQAHEAQWQMLYKDSRVLTAFPDIINDSTAFERGELPTFLTADMQSRIERGYDPLDAMLLAHADKFQGLSKKKTEQQIIKEQQLGLRSRVESNSPPDNEPQVPSDLANAFAAFGLPAESAKKYVK